MRLQTSQIRGMDEEDEAMRDKIAHSSFDS
jgi:hypothetical protein